MSPQPQANKAPTELEAALGYARVGTAVFPCNPLDKKPLTSSGFKNATKDEAQIRAWWQKWPSAMIGAPIMALGHFCHHARICASSLVASLKPLRVSGFLSSGLHGKTGIPDRAYSSAASSSVGALLACGCGLI